MSDTPKIHLTAASQAASKPVLSADSLGKPLIEQVSTLSITANSADLLLRHTVKEAHDPKTGFVDAVRFANVMGITLPEMAKIVNRTPRGLQKNPASVKLQEKLTRLMPIYIGLLDRFDRSDEYVRIWLRAPHPDLGNRTPLSCLEQGHVEVVESLVRAMESGQPS
jgi:hypothetical protein